MGKTRGTTGYHHTEKTKAKISQSVSLYSKGRPKTPEHRAKLAAILRQARPLVIHHSSEERSAKMSASFKQLWVDPVYREKVIKTRQGERNGNWKGGITPKCYPKGFNSQLKETIRIRDSRTCQLCGVAESELKYALAVNHIDHNKDNLLPMNLISLCRSCNSKINGKEKIFYQLYLEAKIKEIYQGGNNGS